MYIAIHFSTSIIWGGGAEKFSVNPFSKSSILIFDHWNTGFREVDQTEKFSVSPCIRSLDKASFLVTCLYLYMFIWTLCLCKYIQVLRHRHYSCYLINSY